MCLMGYSLYPLDSFIIYHTKKKQVPFQATLYHCQNIRWKQSLPNLILSDHTVAKLSFNWIEQMQCRRLWCNNVDGAHKGCRTQHTPWADGTECEPGKASNTPTRPSVLGRNGQDFACRLCPHCLEYELMQCVLAHVIVFWGRRFSFAIENCENSPYSLILMWET